MITCCVRYEIDPLKAKEFEIYAKMWLPLVEKLGGTHHGYFLPREGENIAIALFSFPSLADFEVYRARRASDPDCQKAMAYFSETRCFLRYDWVFLRPLLESGSGAPPKPEVSL